MKNFLDQCSFIGYIQFANGRTASGLSPEHHGHTGRLSGHLRNPLARMAGSRGHGRATHHRKGNSSMKQPQANPMTTSTKDSGRVRLGGGWRLPAAKPTR